MATGPLNLVFLSLLLVMCSLPASQPLPFRVRNIDPRVVPTPAVDPVSTRAVAPPKPDPLENIGVEISQGYLIEGDIRIWHGFPAQPENLRTATTSSRESFSFFPPTNSHQLRNSITAGEIWLEKVIPYEIDMIFNFTEKQIILDAMDEVVAGVNRCVIFVQREKQEDFLYFAGQGSGCVSSIGKQGGNQSISISRASECVSKGIIMHEILHALGFWHEHSRPDRDKYIEINWHNILPGHGDDFDINQNSKMLTTYDYYSIMHYKTTQFSKFSLSLKTIKILQQGIDEQRVGQREYLSDKDKERIILLYQCKNPALRSSINSLQTKQHPGMFGSLYRTTTGSRGETFKPIVINTGRPLDAAFKTPVIDIKGSELNIPDLPQTSTVNTHTEPVGENVDENSMTDKLGAVVKSNFTETAEIGKK